MASNEKYVYAPPSTVVDQDDSYLYTVFFLVLFKSLIFARFSSAWLSCKQKIKTKISFFSFI